ncbi:hypothetical protein CHS0354_018176 [Potamilus streckersoni]|uniref:PH domain-containing protein n=1 Tax=Potamilus streckersoni TaxID=2493646 RepID=A0AAE0STX7_9BIVA|nr:hypothetical protein CHS0354_018176 [Potamilus streckersoni]
MDPYTERLLEQTRLRRERLNEKLGKTPDPAPRKRTLEENTSHNIIQPNLIDDDSPKRHCVREVEKAVHPDTPAISGVKSRLTVLTQARQQWSDSGQENGRDEAPPAMLQQTFEQRKDHSPEPGNRKNRFAQLAQHISNWEDDLSHHKIQKEEEKKPKWQPPKPEPEPFQAQQSSLPSSVVESRERRPSVQNFKKTTPPSPKKTAAPPPPPPPPPAPIFVPVVSRSPVAKWSPKKSAAPPPPTDSAVKLSTATVHLRQPSGSLMSENPKHQVKLAEDMIPVNAPDLEDKVPQLTSEEKTVKPLSERINTWKMKTDTPVKTQKPEDPALQPVSARMASWEQKVSQTPTTERAVSTKLLATPKLTCTPAHQSGSAVKNSAPPNIKSFSMQTPQQSEMADTDPALRPVSDRMASWQQKDVMANPPREEEPTAYSVLARMSAWEHASSSNQVSYVKKVDPGLSPQRSPTKDSLKPVSTPSKPKTMVTSCESFKDSIIERAHQIRAGQSPVHTLPPKPPSQTKGLGNSQCSQSPRIGTSPVRGATTPTKQGLGSPTIVGSATKMLQDRLMEQTVNSKTNQLADKIRQERMAEVNALKNRWQNGILKEDTSSETEAAKVEEHPPHMSVPQVNQAVAGPPQDKREAIKAKARADFDRKLAGMGFDISDQGAAYTFNKNGTRNGDNEVQRREEKINESIPHMQQPSAAFVAAANDQETQKQTESKPTSSIYRLVSKKSDASKKPFVRQDSQKKVRFEDPSSTEEGESGTDRQTSDDLDSTEDFDPRSEESVTETTQESDLTSSQDSFESESDGMEPHHYHVEPVHKQPQQHKQYEMYDDGDDVSLSAFVPPSVRRQSVLPHGPNDDRQSITSEDSIDCTPYRSSHVSTTNLRALAHSGQDSASRQTDEKVRQRQQPVNQSTDESDDEGHSVDVDAFLDEAMDETVCQSKNSQPVAAPRKRMSHMMATTVGELPVQDKPFSHPGNMASSAQPGNLAYSVSMYRSQRGVTTTVQTTVNITRSPQQYENDASQSQMKITRNSHYVQEDIAEEDIEMPVELPPEQQRKTIRERIQELQELVNQEQSVIMQTSNALNQCCSDSSAFAGSSEQVECHRLLLVSCQKRQAYLTEVQRLKETGRLDPPGHGPKGSFTISDIRLPLKKEFVQKIGTASDNIVHYFIILVRNGPQVIVTQMLSTHDPMMRGSLDFPNLIKLHGITGDFKVILEIYSMSVSREVKKEKKKKTPRKQSRHGVTMESPGGPNAVRSTSFTLITTVPLTMKSLDKNSFTLERITYLSPLHGTIYMKLKCMMEQNVEERGFLTMFEDVSGLGAWHRRWCVLFGNKLAFWKYPDDENKKDPIGYIDLKRCITEKVGLVARDICARPNTLEMVTVRPPRKGEKDTLITKTYNTLTTMKHMLSADTKEERIVWCNKINRALANLRTWHADAMRPIKAQIE